MKPGEDGEEAPSPPSDAPAAVALPWIPFGLGVSPVWRERALLAALWILAAVIVVSDAIRPGPDFKIYVASGEAVLQGKDIYIAPLPGRNTGPPFFSLFCVIPALLERVSPVFARGLWTAAGLATLVFVLGLATRLIYSRPLRITSMRVLVPLALTAPYLLSNFLYHQVNVFVFALSLWGLALQEDRKEWRGGVLLGLAAALKVMPILLVLYLIYRFRWRAAVSGLAATAAFTFSPGLVLGWPRFLGNLGYWWTTLPRNPCWDAGHRNQALLAMWDRIVGHGLVPFFSPGADHLDMSGAPGVRVAWLATVAVLAVLYLVAWRKAPERGSLDAVVEWSAILVASIILGPVSWRHYFVVLLLPNLVLYRIWREHGNAEVRRAAGMLLFACFLLCAVSARFPLGEAWCMQLGMASHLTLAALAMIAGLLWLRHKSVKFGGARGAAPASG